jgi:hypothetical protein
MTKRKRINDRIYKIFLWKLKIEQHEITKMEEGVMNQVPWKGKQFMIYYR